MTPIITFACSYQLVNLFTILFWQNMGYWTYHSQLAFGTFQSFFKYKILIYLGVLVNIHYSKNVKFFLRCTLYISNNSVYVRPTNTFVKLDWFFFPDYEIASHFFLRTISYIHAHNIIMEMPSHVSKITIFHPSHTLLLFRIFHLFLWRPYLVKMRMGKTRRTVFIVYYPRWPILWH